MGRAEAASLPSFFNSKRAAHLDGSFAYVGSSLRQCNSGSPRQQDLNGENLSAIGYIRRGGGVGLIHEQYKGSDIIAGRVPDRKKKKIIADYLEFGNYTATGKANGVSGDTVRRIVQSCEDFKKIAQQKKEEDTADILAYMEGKRDKVTEIIGLYLDELLDVRQFKNLSPSQLTTALGTLIDKWTGAAEAAEKAGTVNNEVKIIFDVTPD